MPPKKTPDLHIKYMWHTILLSSNDSNEELISKMAAIASIQDTINEHSDLHKLPNEQLKAENEELNKLNNTLNFNIEIQVMMLDKLKEKIWEEEYNKIKKEIITSELYLKLKERAWL